MANAWLVPLAKNLDAPGTEERALQALQAVLTRAGEGGSEIAESLVPLFQDQLKTARGKYRGLGVLTPYAANSANIWRYVISLTYDEDPGLRLAATQGLLPLMDKPDVEARLFELVSDPNDDIKNTVMQAIGASNLGRGLESAEAALHVIPNDALRATTLELLDELDRAVRLLQDLGLTEGQDLIVNDLILPKIRELRQIFGSVAADLQEASEQRKSSLVTSHHVVGAAQALALAATGIADADDAVRNVQSAAANVIPALQAIWQFVA
jgi:hypothetical protein